MHIKLSPMRRDDTLKMSKSGDTLKINRRTFDFSGVPDGATLPRDAVACEWLASDVERIDGELHLTMILPHGANAPQETLFPESITVTEDGPIALPAHSIEEDAA